MVKDTALSEQLKEEKWGYFRPGFYPMEPRSVVPAMVCLSEFPYNSEPNVQFVLVKANCYLKEWRDALLVSEHDFDDAKTKFKEIGNEAGKIEELMSEFLANGYLPLNKIKTDIKLNNLQ